MSYDLYFRARTPGASISLEEFAIYFSQRRHYKIEGEQAWYANEDTGVYFAFEYSLPDPEEDETDAEAAPLVPVAFNLNYYRPHPFAMEAEPEVRSFVANFDLLVSDPQSSGMGDGEYSTEGFLRGWNAGNEFGYRAIASQAPDAIPVGLPSSTIESIWQWNTRRQTLQTEIGEEAFVPRITFLHQDHRVATAVVWTDAVASLLPKVDALLVLRKRFAPKRWFRSPAEDLVVLEWRQVESVVQCFKRRTEVLACYELFYEEPPAEIEALIRNAKKPTTELQGLSFDQVLNQELLDASRQPKS